MGSITEQKWKLAAENQQQFKFQSPQNVRENNPNKDATGNFREHQTLTKSEHLNSCSCTGKNEKRCSIQVTRHV